MRGGPGRMRGGSGFVYKRGGGILDKTHPPNFGPTHPTFDPPRPPPPLIILWGGFFVNQIEAKALSRVRHPQRVTHQKLHNTRV